MSDHLPARLRITEWSSVTDPKLSPGTRRDICAAAESWRIRNGLATSPLFFAGPDGDRLFARQYVGVVEVNDVAIEIYPKLDASLIEADAEQPLLPSVKIDSVMRNLLWMLEVADYWDLAETETAHLEEAPTSFFDLFAYLLGKKLLPELERGVAHSYVTFEDDLMAVRGRIGLAEQVTRNWNRFDRVYCAWDEFTPDTAINRLFKCACRFLSERVNYPAAVRLLRDCQDLLSEVEDVFPLAALREVENLRFDRSVERFKTAFDLARRLLAGIGHNLGVGDANTFVFLLDMNDVFEKYVHAVLQSHFKTVVEEQKFVGKLLRLHPGGISQKADYFWRDQTGSWIGDAKYKHLAKGHVRALRFCDLEDESEQNASDGIESLAGKVLNPSDIRQLTVYAELIRLRQRTGLSPNLMLLYPFVGPAIKSLPDKVTAWNGSTLWLVPVLVKKQPRVGDAIQFSTGGRASL